MVLNSNPSAPASIAVALPAVVSTVSVPDSVEPLSNSPNRLKTSVTSARAEPGAAKAAKSARAPPNVALAATREIPSINVPPTKHPRQAYDANPQRLSSSRVRTFPYDTGASSTTWRHERQPVAKGFGYCRYIYHQFGLPESLGGKFSPPRRPLRLRSIHS